MEQQSWLLQHVDSLEYEGLITASFPHLDLFKKLRSKQTSSKLKRKEKSNSKNLGEVGATKDFVCETCLETFTRKADLKRHMLYHSGKREFVCDICSKEFTRKDNFDRHMLIHTGRK